MKITASLLAAILTTALGGAVGTEAEMAAPAADQRFGEITAITASDPAAGDEFGLAVAIDGNTMVVGAWRGDDACTADPDCDSGAAYVFYRNLGGADNWGFVKKLTASDAAQYDSFGYTVAISGNRIVVGSPAISNYSSWGGAYIFERDLGGADNWGERIKLLSSDKWANDKFGLSVSISGTTVLVGAPYNDDNGESTGSAYFFERDYPSANTWGQIKKVTASDRYQWDRFGISVAISGDTAIVGAHLEDGGDGSPYTDGGAAYVFERDDGGADNWGEVQKLLASDIADNDEFGISVAISGDTAVVGANFNDDACPGDTGCNSGSAYVFERDQGGPDNWGEVKKLTASDASNGDEFGMSVAIAGGSIVIGAFRADAVGTQSGAGYLFSRDGGGAGNWGALQKVVGSTTSAGDETGRSVGVSGQIAVLGAPFDDGAATDAGCAIVWTVPEASLTWFIVDPPPEQ
jgi:hypothetical protein